ncbi:9276_t:CDS:2, partial [Gigaspora rosea]
MQIKDKVVILTGGANGIGAALARRLVSEGNKVNAIFIFCDVTNFDHLSQLFDTAQNTFGGVDIVFNNAGIGQENEFYDQTS